MVNYCKIMETIEKIHEYFDAALRMRLNEMGRGAQKTIALDVGITKSAMSQIAKGKRAAVKTQEAIAKACGYQYEEFLSLGKALVSGEPPKDATSPPFPGYNKIMRLPILDRAWAILRAAGEQHGITEYMASSGANPKPKFAKKFMAGEQTEEELYAECYERMRELADQTREALKKMGVDVKE